DFGTNSSLASPDHPFRHRRDLAGDRQGSKEYHVAGLSCVGGGLARSRGREADRISHGGDSIHQKSTYRNELPAGQRSEGDISRTGRGSSAAPFTGTVSPVLSADKYGRILDFRRQAEGRCDSGRRFHGSLPAAGRDDQHR